MTEKAQATNQKLITGTGRRKTAIARVFLYEKKGEFTINDKPIKDYFPSELEQSNWLRPFHTVGVAHPESKFSATIKILGSGKNSQMGALIHGLSHALSKISEEWSIMLRKQGLLTRDSRMVERKKYNLHKARKATQYSKR